MGAIDREHNSGRDPPSRPQELGRYLAFLCQDVVRKNQTDINNSITNRHFPREVPRDHKRLFPPPPPPARMNGAPEVRESGLVCLLSILLGTEEKRQQAQVQAWAAPGATGPVFLVSRPRAGVSLAPRVAGAPECPEATTRIPQCPLRDQAHPLFLLSPHSSSSSLGFTDQEAIQELESSLKEIRKTASWIALYYAGLFLWLMGRHDKAKEYIDRMLQLSNSAREVPTTGITRATARESSVPTQPSGVAMTPPDGHGMGGGPQPGTAKTLGLHMTPPRLSPGSVRYKLAFVQSPICR